MTNTYNYCFSNLTNDLFMSKMKNAAHPPSFTDQVWFWNCRAVTCNDEKNERSFSA